MELQTQRISMHYSPNNIYPTTEEHLARKHILAVVPSGQRTFMEGLLNIYRNSLIKELSHDDSKPSSRTTAQTAKE